MCRRQYLMACVMMGFGLGLLIGHCLESWFLCSCIGIAFLVLGCSGLRRK